MMDKAALRAKACEQREQMNPLDVQERSAAFVGQFKTMNWPRTGGVAAVYLAMPGEADPFALTEHLRKLDYAIAVPAYDRESKRYHLVELRPGAALKQSHFGVFEPEELIPVDHQNVDIMLVPGLAFDASGNRLGQGKGHYDYMLEDGFRDDLLLVGLCFEEQLVDQVPAEEHDVRMSLVVTDQQVIRPQD